MQKSMFSQEYRPSFAPFLESRLEFMSQIGHIIEMKYVHVDEII